MGVTGLLEPSLLDFPLAGDRYRCDGPEVAGYELRDPDLVRPVPIPVEDLAPLLDTRRTPSAVRAQLWEQIEGTVVRERGELICRPEIWRYVSEPATGVPDGENRVLLNQFAWRLYGLSVVLGLRLVDRADGARRSVTAGCRSQVGLVDVDAVHRSLARLHVVRPTGDDEGSGTVVPDPSAGRGDRI